MKLFICSIESVVDAKLIRHCLNTIELLVDDLLRGENYGSGLNGSFMLVIRILDERLQGSNYYKPVTRYQAKKMYLVISEEIPWREVIKDDEALNYRLVCEALLSAARKMPHLKIKNFDVTRFHDDLVQLIAKKQWIG